MKKIRLLLGAFLVIFLGLGFASASTPGNISSCQIIDTSGSYILTKNIAITQNCFTITANNIVLNGNGWSINGDFSGKGINVLGVSNISILNFKINDFATGVYFELVSNSLIENNTLNNSSNAGILLYLNSNNNKLLSNNLSFNGMGIFLDAYSSNNLISKNSQRNSIIAALDFGASSNNNVTQNYAEYNYQGLLFESISSNNLITDSVFSNSIDLDLYVNGEKGNSLNNVLLNVTTNPAKEAVDFGSMLIRKWYVDITVLDHRPLANAEVNASYSAGPLMDSKLTDDAGKARLVIIDYIINNGIKINFSPYTIRVSASGYQNANQSYNINSNLNLNAFMSKNGISTITLAGLKPLKKNTNLDYSKDKLFNIDYS